MDFSKDLAAPLDGNAYTPLFFRLIDNVLLYEKNMGIYPEKIQLDFDDQGGAGKFAIEWYGRLMHDNRTPYALSEEHKSILEGTPRMLTDLEYVPLQAADMLAWSIRRNLTYRDDPGWDWLFTALQETLWAGCGFSKASWDAIKSGLPTSVKK